MRSPTIERPLFRLCLVLAGSAIATYKQWSRGVRDQFSGEAPHGRARVVPDLPRRDKSGDPAGVELRNYLQAWAASSPVLSCVNGRRESLANIKKLNSPRYRLRYLKGWAGLRYSRSTIEGSQRIVIKRFLAYSLTLRGIALGKRGGSILLSGTAYSIVDTC